MAFKRDVNDSKHMLGKQKTSTNGLQGWNNSLLYLQHNFKNFKNQQKLVFMRFNFQSLSYLAFAGLILFSSCKKDEEDTTPVKVEPTSYTAKLLGAQSNNAGSFFSPKDGKVYSTGDSLTFAANGVDISFAQTGSPTSPKFVSLSARAGEGLRRVTTVNRATTFTATAYTKAQFDTVSNGFVKGLASGGTLTVGVEQSKVYKFINAEGKKGLAYVSNLTLGTGTDGTVTIDVKFEK